MKIEEGKFYKHPSIPMPYVAVRRGEVQGKECWILVSMKAMVELSMHKTPIPFTDEWGVSDEYATSSGMVEVDPKDYEITEDGNVICKKEEV